MSGHIARMLRPRSIADIVDTLRRDEPKRAREAAPR